MIVINFKNYVYGQKSLKLAKKIEKILPNAILTVSAVDIGYLIYFTKLKVYAQHVDFHEKGKTTGFLIPEAAKAHGASGTLLNHSEHKLKFDELKKTMLRCKKVNLKVIVCAANLIEVKKIKKLNPFAIAFEDPKLISTGKSITKYKTNELKKFVSLLKNTKIIPLCGAGINSKNDYLEALNLGCKGILVSSVIANSKNPEIFLKGVS